VTHCLSATGTITVTRSDSTRSRSAPLVIGAKWTRSVSSSGLHRAAASCESGLERRSLAELRARTSHGQLQISLGPVHTSRRFRVSSVASS